MYHKNSKAIKISRQALVKNLQLSSSYERMKKVQRLKRRKRQVDHDLIMS